MTISFWDWEIPFIFKDFLSLHLILLNIYFMINRYINILELELELREGGWREGGILTRLVST